MSRLLPPAKDTLTPEQHEVHNKIASGPRGAVVGPLGVWLWRPELADRAQALGEYCRYNSSLSKRLSELAIIITGRHWASEFEWQHHKPIAIEAGLDEKIVEAIRRNDEPEFSNEDEKAVYALSTELWRTKNVSAATYKNAIDKLGQDAVVDLVGVLGYYGFISMTINAFEVAADGPNELET